MTHKDRKTRRLRGSRSHGYGNTQKHRGGGSRGGVGMAGSKKHKWSFVSKNMPNYFGTHGFKRPKCMIDRVNSINVGFIDENLEGFVSDGTAKLENNRYIINLTDIGYDKLLGSGRVAHPIMVTVRKCSKSALEKINGAGGAVECTGLEEKVKEAVPES